MDGVHVQAASGQLLGDEAESLPGLVHVGYRAVEVSGGGAALGMVLGVLLMALGAQRFRAGGQPRVAGLGDAMVAVALPALGPFVLLEGLLVFAAVKQAGIARVTEAATLAHARQTHGHGSVVAVAIVARRRAQIAALQQRPAVNAGPILRQLIGGNERT